MKKHLEILFIISLLTGVVMRWLHVDERAVLLNTTLICVGVFALVDSIRLGYYKNWTIESISLLLSVVIILLAANNLFSEVPKYTGVGAAVVLQFVVTKRRQLLTKRN